jgi:hypothetical protein
MMQDGASTGFIRDSAGHENVKAIENYLAGFDEDIKWKFTGILSNPG